ncbi:hypothetical protein I4641_06600 [Waterburya agarophytonicola K14]|uniref:Uncharacterized protein n=1 Tax=Waterburya agarophytonicola KI4 TaxID=2874699 RepID=A0A964BPU4_9CYAN|nr:hypothetical protein [Waterburya agarophytonicola]MCC0176647.1 hypothetical protein [Waterburya agarophytonicola KI4]
MQLINKINSWDNHLLDRLGSSVYSRVDSWLIAHPLLHWLANHPLIGSISLTVGIILVIRLFLTIYRSIASTIDRMWLWILRSPFLLLKFLFGWEVKSKQDQAKTSITNYEITNNPQQLQEIVNRLESIQQQQQQILQDIALLKKRSHWGEAQEINLQLAPRELPSALEKKA